jgi:hypothetical protein
LLSFELSDFFDFDSLLPALLELDLLLPLRLFPAFLLFVDAVIATNA